ncbi:MAG TPA: molecular chaperone HtpG [Desulfobacteria bacterium]|nr:molecular chaperone HtpG [Desulfobacteria bacterium]
MGTTETKEFQTEIRQLLDLVINSLYTDREIFLRELISNANDAMEKIRYMQLTGQNELNQELPLEINITTDDKAHTITIADTGIGMTKAELVENLGTIAHSGSKEFIRRLSESRGEQDNLKLIGQFGVGFYSAFMVADRVSLFTCSNQPEAGAFVWKSDGRGSYTIEETEGLSRGTKIVLELKEDAYELGKEETVRRIIRQYSSFVPYPINLNGQKVNTVQALWTKNKNEISEEEYTEFYKFIANAYDEPLFRLHFSSDAPLNINALLYVPKENMERLGFGRVEPGVNLYCKKVLIQEQAKDIVPEWMRFVKGVVDSEELPLNISRETMQDSALVAKLNKVVSGRFLRFLAEQAKSEPEKYQEFWQKFNIFIKEGAANDFTHRQELVKLLRFETSKTEPGELISLADYLEHMQDGQKDIYYVNGPTREVIEAGPYLEAFRDKDYEVLYTHEAIDDYVLTTLGEYEGKKLVSVDQADADLGGSTTEDQAGALPEAEQTAFNAWLKEILGSKVTDVRASKRLVDSPAILLSPYGTHSMQRMMQMMNQDLAHTAPGLLEINAKHPLIKRLNELRRQGEDFAKVAAEQLYENAQIAAGIIVDPRNMVTRLNEILERALG